MERFTDSVPDPLALLGSVLLVCTNRWGSELHGVHHWQCVAETALRLLPHAPGADPAVAFLFAVFHDAMRINDRRDDGHGARGGELARRLHGQQFTLRPKQLDLLGAACAGHTDGDASTDPTIAVCWDADRLNLWRCGIEPDPAFLSLPAARDDDTIIWAAGLQSVSFDWPDLHARYAAHDTAAKLAGPSSRP